MRPHSQSLGTLPPVQNTFYRYTVHLITAPYVRVFAVYKRATFYTDIVLANPNDDQYEAERMYPPRSNASHASADRSEELALSYGPVGFGLRELASHIPYHPT
jgi:hypothetical protein